VLTEAQKSTARGARRLPDRLLHRPRRRAALWRAPGNDGTQSKRGKLE